MGGGGGRGKVGRQEGGRKERREEGKSLGGKWMNNGNKTGYLNKRSPKWIVSWKIHHLAQLVALPWVPANLYSTEILFFSSPDFLTENSWRGGENASLTVKLALFLSTVWCLADFTEQEDFPGPWCYARLVCAMASSLRLNFTDFVTTGLKETYVGWLVFQLNAN